MSENKQQTGYTIFIDGTDYTEYIPMPFKWSSLLDERLDEGRMSMRHCPVPLFAPMSGVKITISDKSNTVTEKVFLVSSDDSSEAPAGSGYYNHEIMLIEETKKLEGIIIDSLTFTNSLGRNYTANAELAEPIYEEEGKYNNKWIKRIDSGYMTPWALKESIAVTSIRQTIIPFLNIANQVYYLNPNPTDDAPNKITVTFPDGIVITIATDLDTSGSFIPAQMGTYIIRYQGAIDYQSGDEQPQRSKFNVALYITTVVNQKDLSKWTVASVIERLLDVGQVHLKNQSPKYELNAEQKAEFEKIEAPEFAFSKMTLREALDQIGGFIHGMARLKGNTIYYDMLGGTEKATLSDPKYPYISNKYSQNVESYATELDSTVDNLVNILDADEGVITEPYAGGFKTVRSEEAYARITDGNMIISTSFPIYSVQKLEVRDPDGNVKDITAYLFESAAYGLMSSFDGLYPRSKAFAIYYTQGQKNIKGLSLKVPSAIGGAGAKYAIANIIKAVGGMDISASWWNDITDKDEKTQSGKYPTLQFRITYTPVFSARVKQHKFYYKDFAHPRSLAYNQSANLVETRYYGENMRGLIARTGNAEIIRTYRLNSFSLLPTAGQMWDDDYYVSSVTVAVMPFYIDCSVGLSKDFNRLSQYIGINSMHRIYEVSEKQAFDRDIVYSDYCVIGDDRQSDGLHLISLYGVNTIANTFRQTGNDLPISGACVTTIAEDNSEYSATLPAISTAMGNTLVFSFYMEDSYSAGQKSVYGTNGEIQGYWQTNVEYNDYYGRFDFMKLQFIEQGITPPMSDRNSAIPYDLPQGTYPSLNEKLRPLIVTPDDNPLKIRKNSTEIIHMHYQIHFVSNRKDIIVGPALTHNCPLVRGVRGEEHSATLYVLPQPLNKFADKIDLSAATKIWDYSDGGVTAQSAGISFAKKQSAVDGAAWAIADKKTGELLFGSNTPVKNGETITLPTLTFKHNIYTEV